MNDDNVREKMFEERLHAIHALSQAVQGEPSMDTNRDEMLAMFDSFLGEDFDSSKKESVIRLQQNLHRGQTLLAKQLEHRVITDAEYVDRFNHLVATVFEACENLLGVSNFEALFGAPRSEMQGYINKGTFVASRGHYSGPSKVSLDFFAPKRRHLSDQMVLIVDDSKNYRVQLHGAFERAGYRVLAAESGWVALEMLKTHQPDLMLVDIKMPIMSGYELVDIVHRRPKTAKVQVLMMTSKMTKTTLAEAVCVGASSVFMKPTEPEKLVSNINRSFEH